MTYQARRARAVPWVLPAQIAVSMAALFLFGYLIAVLVWGM